MKQKKKQPQKQRRYRPRPQLSGEVRCTAGGRAFFVPDNGSRDLPVADGRLGGAMHGDRVKARRLPLPPNGGRPQAEVVAVTERAFTTLVGTYRAGSEPRLIPDEKYIPPFAVLWEAKRGQKKPKDGDKVVVEITDYPTAEEPLRGRITEVLGPADDPRVALTALIRTKDLPHRFSPAALAAARRAPQQVTERDRQGREDLRGWCTVTIDGADAKDFDDAVSCTPLPEGGYLLGVHIADVAHYVKKNGALDRDARRRGTSVYFPGLVLPMLPTELSNGICSLNEGVDRLTLSCLMELDETGRIRSHRLAETVIRSRRRLIYDDVSAALAGDVQQQKALGEVWPMLRELSAAAKLLRRRRSARGAVDFDLPEPDIRLDDKGNVTDVRRAQRGEAERIIEDCMLAANETVAAHMVKGKLPYLYRVHEQPDGEKITRVNSFLKSIGHGVKTKDIREVKPREIAAAVTAAQDTPEADVVAKLLLRSMQKARYAPDCLGHFGLACRYYCHFTSPIRRYPDLTGHRILKEMFHHRLDGETRAVWEKELPELAEHCSQRERAAVEAERAADDMACRRFLLSHMGETFPGVIAGVTGYGLYVELDNTAEGLVRIRTLPGREWEYDPDRYCITARGGIKTRRFRLGDPLLVRVDGGSVENGVELTLAELGIATGAEIGYDK